MFNVALYLSACEVLNNYLDNKTLSLLITELIICQCDSGFKEILLELVKLLNLHLRNTWWVNISANNLIL